MAYGGGHAGDPDVGGGHAGDSTVVHIRAKAWWMNQGQFWSPDLVEIARPVVESVDDNLLRERYGELQEMLGAVICGSVAMPD